MKKLILFSMVCVFLAVPSRADYFVGFDNLSQTGAVGGINYSSGAGGEFTIDSSALSIAAYAPTTSGIKGGANSFQTFCVERGEFVSSPVDIVVSTTWAPDATPLVPQWGAAPALPASHALLGGGPVGDDLNPQTAYLYTQFATGVLSNYVYGVGRQASAGALQNAIWFMEAEIPVLPAGQATLWVQEAVDATGLAIGGLVDKTPGVDPWGATIGNVRILNTYVKDTYGTTYKLKQDQLYLVPVPAAVLLGMLGLSVAGLKLRKYA